jgi:hypothetical protein
VQGFVLDFSGNKLIMFIFKMKTHILRGVYIESGWVIIHLNLFRINNNNNNNNNNNEKFCVCHPGPSG